MDDQNLTPRSIYFFVAGKVAGKTWVVLKYEKIEKGWTSDIVFGKAPHLRNVYVSGETRDDLAEWYPCDFINRPYLSDTFDDAMEYIARKSDLPLMF